MVEIVDGGIAQRAGVTGGDVLVSLAGQPLRSLAELARALRHAGALATTELTWLRGDAAHGARVDVSVLPLETHAGHDVRFGVLDVPGARLRTVETRPNNDAEVLGTVMFVQGIACESVDPPGETFSALLSGWMRAGFATFRVDKRGCGDSEGSCVDAGFDVELDDVRRALAFALDVARVPRPLFLFGHSVGGMIAAVLASSQPPSTNPILAGVMVYGTSTARWLDCLSRSARRQLALVNAPDAHVEERLRDVERATVTGLNGRSGAYHRELHALDLVAAWAAVRVPVLVLRGAYDWVVDAEEQARIQQIAPDPSMVLVEDLAGLDHMLGWHACIEDSVTQYGAGAVRDDVARRTVEWMRARR